MEERGRGCKKWPLSGKDREKKRSEEKTSALGSGFRRRQTKSPVRQRGKEKRAIGKKTSELNGVREGRVFSVTALEHVKAQEGKEKWNLDENQPRRQLLEPVAFTIPNGGEKGEEPFHRWQQGIRGNNWVVAISMSLHIQDSSGMVGDRRVQAPKELGICTSASYLP